MKYQIDHKTGSHRSETVIEAKDTTQLLQRFLLTLVDVRSKVDVTGIKILSPTPRALPQAEVENFNGNVNTLHNAMDNETRARRLHTRVEGAENAGVGQAEIVNRINQEGT